MKLHPICFTPEGQGHPTVSFPEIKQGLQAVPTGQLLALPQLATEQVVELQPVPTAQSESGGIPAAKPSAS